MQDTESKPTVDRNMEEYVSECSEKAADCVRQTKTMIRDKPVESAAVAFAIGYAASVLPVGRVAIALTRTTARLVPYGIFALGCAKLWSLARECQGELRRVPEE
jgi:hypothetical protein